MAKTDFLDLLINNDTAENEFDIDGTEDLFEIDIDSINSHANTLAVGKINNLLRLYNDKEFTDSNPEFKKRVDNEIDTLRRLIKMAETNEAIHDNLVKAISHKPDNASLYRALTKLQKNIITIQTQISQIMKEFTQMCKAYQTEITFKTEDNSNTSSNEFEEMNDGSTTSRGRKAFISSMNNFTEEE